ncbi:class I SAM-dependent methyltransferase [Streptomyces sp. RM72]|uniref:class I SAM-dependent methyltransferase n=1 Tax=unclassified Streptomyces TaxID=2593676 RepID=UPI00187D3C0D|nr:MULTISPECIES: class I SAM-dependent methyltransferase [unclassified Streptomyces]MBQ0888714.1 class I SAM-dependent methyltransferase [Streptomyces sp. RM72]
MTTDESGRTSYDDGVLGHARPGELDRLALLEATCDPATWDVIAGLPLTPDASFAVVGAGNGRLARRLAQRFPGGRVMATDIDTALLDAQEWPSPVTVRPHDVTRDDLTPAEWDLVHARAVLTHLPGPEQLVQRMASWLTPGRGWLVVEDPTYLKPALSGRQEWAALLENCETLLATTQGTDAGWAGRIPAAMAAAGLTDIRVSVRVATVGEGGVEDRYWRACFEQARPALVAHGLMTDEEVERGMSCLDDPTFRDMAWTMVSCAARRP